jgi:hypothetical protein
MKKILSVLKKKSLNILIYVFYKCKTLLLFLATVYAKLKSVIGTIFTNLKSRLLTIVEKFLFKTNNFLIKIFVFIMTIWLTIMETFVYAWDSFYIDLTVTLPNFLIRLNIHLKTARKYGFILYTYKVILKVITQMDLKKPMQSTNVIVEYTIIVGIVIIFLIDDDGSGSDDDDNGGGFDGTKNPFF